MVLALVLNQWVVDTARDIKDWRQILCPVNHRGQLTKLPVGFLSGALRTHGLSKLARVQKCSLEYRSPWQSETRTKDDAASVVRVCGPWKAWSKRPTRGRGIGSSAPSTFLPEHLIHRHPLTRLSCRLFTSMTNATSDKVMCRELLGLPLGILVSVGLFSRLARDTRSLAKPVAGLLV